MIQAGFANAATRLESHAVQGGTSTTAAIRNPDALLVKQRELDYKRSEALLHQMQQIVNERAIYAPIWQLGFINGVGPRVAGSS
jgi:peptide/nickel transport system substrate-binding protein